MSMADGQQNQFRIHKWFAWYPVKTVDGFWVWFEYVYRELGWVVPSAYPDEAITKWEYSKIED